jgi:hypothetical protein
MMVSQARSAAECACHFHDDNMHPELRDILPQGMLVVCSATCMSCCPCSGDALHLQRLQQMYNSWGMMGCVLGYLCLRHSCLRCLSVQVGGASTSKVDGANGDGAGCSKAASGDDEDEEKEEEEDGDDVEEDSDRDEVCCVCASEHMLCSAALSICPGCLTVISQSIMELVVAAFHNPC